MEASRWRNLGCAHGVAEVRAGKGERGEAWRRGASKLSRRPGREEDKQEAGKQLEGEEGLSDEPSRVAVPCGSQEDDPAGRDAVPSQTSASV